MKVKGVTTMDLLYHTCRCGELCVDGFFQQLKVDYDMENKKAKAYCPCSKCDLVYVRRFQLTEGSGKSHRLISWVGILWKLALWGLIPQRFAMRMLGIGLWLERNVPI